MEQEPINPVDQAARDILRNPEDADEVRRLAEAIRTMERRRVGDDL